MAPNTHRHFNMRLGLLALAAAITLGTAGNAMARNDWTGGTTGSWYDPANWGGTLPGSTGTYYLNASANITINIDRTTGDPTATGGEELRVGDGARTPNNPPITAYYTQTLNITDDANDSAVTFDVGALILGRRNGSVATVNQYSGIVSIGGLAIGGNANTSDGLSYPTGTYHLSGGSVTVDGTTSIGNDGASAGTGTLKIDGSNASFTTGSLSMKDDVNGGSTLAFVLDAGGVTAITSTGNVSLQGILDVSLDGYVFGTSPDAITLIDYSATGGSLDGTLNAFTTINLHGFTADVDYTTGNQVRLTNIAAPEPASAALLLIGAGGLLMLRRRQQAGNC